MPVVNPPTPKKTLGSSVTGDSAVVPFRYGVITYDVMLAPVFEGATQYRYMLP